jgi:hypothetical protein
MGGELMTRVFFLIAIAVVFLAGCSATSVHDEWKQPGFRGHSIGSLLIVGLPENSAIGNECADEFVRQLTERHVSATAGYKVIPLGSSRDAIMAKARELRCDAVLVSTFRERKTEFDIYPSQNQSIMQWPDLFMWSPSEYTESRYDVFMTFVYEAATGTAVWSAVSDTFVGQSQQKVLKSYVKAMLKRMEKGGLLAR